MWTLKFSSGLNLMHSILYSNYAGSRATCTCVKGRGFAAIFLIDLALFLILDVPKVVILNTHYCQHAPIPGFLFCLVFAMSWCASVYMCFVVICWERADLLALVCGVWL